MRTLTSLGAPIAASETASGSPERSATILFAIAEYNREFRQGLDEGFRLVVEGVPLKTLYGRTGALTLGTALDNASSAR